ncbi:MAG: nucleotidyl transferase AbiEii/AbiGii toxin family protein [Candidatus Margulisiibacteriota bacterium]
MLTFEQICEYFPKELIRINPKGILVEYLQYELLDSIFKQPYSENLSFIGGTAIRMIYNSKRFSEDLDFDNFGLDFKGFKTLLSKACAEMRLKGFDLEYEFINRAPHYHCYLKFPKLLFEQNISRHRSEKILVSVDAEEKLKYKDPEVKLLNKFGIYRNLLVNPPDILLSQKLLAILQKKREKGRDFYDASFLWGLTEPNLGYLEKRTNLSAETFKQKIIARCEKLNYQSLAKDVEAFLFDEEQKLRVLNFLSLLKGKFKN